VKVIGNLTKDAIIRAAVSEGLTVTQVLGSETSFESSGRCDSVDIVYDSNAQKVVIAYRDNSNSSYGTAIVGTVSGTSISFGTAVVFHNDTTNYIRIDYDANAQKVVIVYQDDNDSNKGTGIVGTVSGTSISFGSPAVFATDVAHISIAYDTNAQKNVISYQHGGNSDYGTAIVGTVSGTSISYGSAAVYENSAVMFTETTYDSTAQKVILAWRDYGDSNKGKSAVGTVSGTSISYGSIVTFESGGIDEVRLAYDPNQNKTGFFYTDAGNSYYGTSTVATVSGTSISFGTAQVFESARIKEFAAIYDTLAQRIVLTYRDMGNSEKGTIVTASISGTSMTFGDAVVFTNDPRNFASTYDSNQQKVVVAFDDEGLSNGRSMVIKTGYTSATGGTIADGSAVIVNANGTVSTVGQTAASVGAAVVYESANTGEQKAAFDSTNNKIVINYRDVGNSSYGTAVVGTVSGDSISFGTPVVFESSATNYNDIVFDSSTGKVVVIFSTSSTGQARVGTVSGTSISFGGSVVFDSGQGVYMALAYDSSNSKVVVGYAGTNNYLETKVGTVSGTSISFGTAVVAYSASFENLCATFDSNSNKVVFAFKRNATGRAVVGTVSGTSVSYGSSVVYESSSATILQDATFDTTNNKVVIAYRASSASDAGRAVVGTVSGTSITFGTAVQFTATSSEQLGITFDSSVGKVIIAYDDGGTSKGTVVSGTVSGTSITFDSALVYEDASVEKVTAVFDSNANKTVIAYKDAGNSNYGTGIVFTPLQSSLTTENFVGFMKGAALDGTNGEILSSCSIARNQTSLTPGQTYFVSPTDGSLSTSAGSPSVTAGTAISNTELIVKG
jgi:hypothetical protein|tara:strand:- start:859 stop:3390 length:2532 start_codon:yes stop_codon:yes gene_type:complete